MYLPSQSPREDDVKTEAQAGGTSPQSPHICKGIYHQMSGVRAKRDHLHRALSIQRSASRDPSSVSFNNSDLNILSMWTSTHDSHLGTVQVTDINTKTLQIEMLLFYYPRTPLTPINTKNGWWPTP